MIKENIILQCPTTNTINKLIINDRFIRTYRDILLNKSTYVANLQYEEKYMLNRFNVIYLRQVLTEKIVKIKWY